MLTKFRNILLCLIVACLLTGFSVQAQQETDTVFQNQNIDSLKQETDSVAQDSARNATISKDALKSRVDYTASDSIYFDVEMKMVEMYDKATLDYENIALDAAKIKIDFDKRLLYADFTLDSLGDEYGIPKFKEGEKYFESKGIIYNYETKKGIIKDVRTQEGEGFIYGSLVKKLPNDALLVKSGWYTTCDLEHPHYSFNFNKAKMIPDDKIITGPVYLKIEDVPLPVALPFGLFPNKKGKQSGIIIPSYGESDRDGYYFKDGGYYFAGNDYYDLALKGYISTSGSWAMNTHSNYKKRYKYNGYVDFNYAFTKIGTEEELNYSEQKTFFLRWLFNQDQKAHPNSKFKANVNAGSSQHNTNRPQNLNDFHQNTLESSITYDRSWDGKYFLNTSLLHRQNTKSKTILLELPSIRFNTTNFYPLRNDKKTRSTSVFSSLIDNLSLSYTLTASNKINTTDSLFFQSSLKDFSNGAMHSVPIKTSAKIFKYVTWSSNMNLTSRMYPQSIRKQWSTAESELIQDTIDAFYMPFDYSMSTSFSTRLFGMFSFKKGPVKAIRHVLTPSTGLSYTPDFSEQYWGYYRYYMNSSLEPQQYSIFENGIYGSPPGRKSGKINMSLSNNLEMKVRNEKDTVTGDRKIVLIENFTISTSYDLARDTMKWNPVSMSGYTKLFKKLDIRYSANFDPYIIDSSGRNLNQFEWDVNNRVVRMADARWNLGLNYNVSSSDFKNGKKPSDRNNEDNSSTNLSGNTNQTQTDSLSSEDFSWSLNIRYTFSHFTDFDRKNMNPVYMSDVVQNLELNGEVQLTKFWKVGWRGSYDFEAQKMSYISADIYRDLHCWEMSFNWVPIGYGGVSTYHFTIKLKASLLEDLKVEKKKQPWDD